MMRRTALSLMLAGALAGCGSGSAQGPTEGAEPSASASAPSTPSTDAAVSSEPASDTPTATGVTGVLGGDEQLEGGCVWLDTDQGRIEPLWPAGYTVTTEPVTLLDPQGETVAREGDSVTIIGEPAGDVATICQVGALWNVTDVEMSDR